MASLLLRLFNSDYFSPHLAVSYLRTYSDNIGITYYIINQLRSQFAPEDVEFYWPQLCHLLISRPSKSRALESFILERCDESVHVALLTLWYLQAALSDLSTNATTPSFKVCHRVFNKCQRILFDDPLSATAVTSRSVSSTRAGTSRLVVTSRTLAAEKVLPCNIGPALVGVGAVLASVPGMPPLAVQVGPVAIEQGRAKPDGLDRSAIEGIHARTGSTDDEDDGVDDDDDDGAAFDDSGSEGDAREWREGRGGDADADEVGNGATSGDEGNGHRGSREPTAHGTEAADEEGAVGRATVTKGRETGALSTSSPTRSSFPPLPMGDSEPPATAPPQASMHRGPSQSMSLSYSQASSSAASRQSQDRSSNPFASMSSLASSFNEFKGKVSDVFGQSLITFVPGPVPSRPGQPPQKSPGSGATASDPPPWYPQRRSRRSEMGRNRRSGRFSSVPNLLHSVQSPSTSTLPDDSNGPQPPDLVLAQYDREARRRLLRSNYCRSQTQFLLTLQDISARLLLIPKPARLSALRAELTALNHKLPAAVCFPLWCRAEAREGQEAVATSIKPSQARPHWRAASSGGRQTEERHHRVVRINPSEAVVLNSADRVPFLLHVEVLDDDLDFDAERKQNREVLKKLVVQEDARRRNFALSRSHASVEASTSKDGVAATQASPGKPALVPADEAASGPGAEDGPAAATLQARPTTPALTVTPSTASSPVPSRAATPGGGTKPSQSQSNSSHSLSAQAAAASASADARDAADVSASPSLGQDEEIDLTEQAYGSDLAAFGEEPKGDSDEEDLAHMNRAHDAATWSRSQSADGASQTTAAAARLPAASAANGGRSKDFSLEEYSERMRTAAIMLAQLNQSTNAGAQPNVIHQPQPGLGAAQGGWSSWIIGINSTSAGGASASSHGSASGTKGRGGAQGGKSEVGQGTAGVRAPLNGMGSGAGAMAFGGATSPVVIRPGGSAAAPGSSVSGTSSAAALGSSGTAKLVNTHAEAIRKRIMQEMMALEEERMQRMRAGPGRARTVKRADGAAAEDVEDEETVLKAVNKDDPSAAIFRETWAAKKARIRKSSPYGHLASWDVFSVIVKTGADLRQEQLAVQLIQEFGRIWRETASRCWVRYFRILVTSENSGLMETVTNAISIHSIKKEAYSRNMGGDDGKLKTYSLMDHFVQTYGDPSSAKFGRARDRFLESLAGYSIISYLLQIKDRHNGNILVDGEGHLIHIDFGFMLGISPGGVGFEAAPFKMPQEYIDIIGGVDSAKWEEFKALMRTGFRDIRKHAERIIMIVELMQKDSRLPCFALGELTTSNLRDRFQLALSQQQCDEFVDRLVMASAGSAFTALYDRFQYYTQGVL